MGYGQWLRDLGPWPDFEDDPGRVRRCTLSEIDPEKLLRLTQAFTFLIKVDTFAINHAAMAIDREIAKGNDDLDHQATWDAVYLILSHAANLSKIFWPIDKRPEIQIRGRVMRELFDVTDAYRCTIGPFVTALNTSTSSSMTGITKRSRPALSTCGLAPTVMSWTSRTTVFRSFDHTEGICRLALDGSTSERSAERLTDCTTGGANFEMKKSIRLTAQVGPNPKPS